ncbi:MAG TPA: hypothetical protein VIC55_03610, partial [Gemmatimonadaceae bacterium]
MFKKLRHEGPGAGLFQTDPLSDTEPLPPQSSSRSSSVMARAEITTPEVIAEESVVELSLRPQRLDEFIG